MVDVNQELSYTIREKITVINNQLYCPTDDLPAVSLSVGVAFTDRANPARASSRMLTRRCTVSSRTQARLRLLSAHGFCTAAPSAGPAFPRRCPFCGSLLGPDALQGTVCPACVPEMRLQHSGASAGVASTILRRAGGCRGVLLRGYCTYSRFALQAGGCFGMPGSWRTVWPCWCSAHCRPNSGKMPQYAGVTALPLYNCIAGAARQPLPGVPGLPLLLARRLGAVLGSRWRHRCTSSAGAARRRS